MRNLLFFVTLSLLIVTTQAQYTNWNNRPAKMPIEVVLEQHKNKKTVTVIIRKKLSFIIIEGRMYKIKFCERLMRRKKVGVTDEQRFISIVVGWEEQGEIITYEEIRRFPLGSEI